MTRLTRRDDWEAMDPLARFDRLFDEWMQYLPFRRTGATAGPLADQMIRVDELREDDTLVVRAELPGIDPDEDVEVTVADRMLTIRAERREEEEREGRGFVRRELRTGSFSRTLSLPEGVTEEDISASYKDGILEIRVPMPEAGAPAAKRIPIESD